jgi:LPXTG-site transpeptidase (sortase) family protein
MMQKIQATKFIILRALANTLILGSLTFLAISLFPLIKNEFLYYYRHFRGMEYHLEETATAPPSAPPSSTPRTPPEPLTIVPADTDFGIVIERTGVNAPIVPDVDTNSHADYMEAMRHGVAHAQGTAKPNEIGNVYLFAHSTLNFWEFGPYATVFTTLHQIVPGDKIVLFYQNKRYDYRVEEKEIVPGFDMTPLDRESSRRILTLQTCDPPGATWRRLIVIAELVYSEE